MQRERHLYVIRNARLDPEWAHVERRTMSIAGRAITSLIQTQGKGDVFRIFAVAQRDQVDFNLAYIPDIFKAVHKEEFDNTYMRQLFELGYGLAKNGYDWVSNHRDFSGLWEHSVGRVELHCPRVRGSGAGQERRDGRGFIWLIWSVLFIWLVSFTKQTKQTK